MNARWLSGLVFLLCFLVVDQQGGRGDQRTDELFLQRALRLQQKLYDASGTGNASLVRRLVDKGADVNYTYRDGETALMRATINGNSAVVELLLKRRAEINWINSFGLTAVDLAIMNKHLSVLKILLKHGAKVNVAHQAPPGGIILGQAVPPLPLAAEGGNVAMLRMLLEVGARTDSRDPGKGDTALIVATRHGNLAAVKLLLSKNADRHLKNKNAESALSIAQKKKNVPLVKLLR